MTDQMRNAGACGLDRRAFVGAATLAVAAAATATGAGAAEQSKVVAEEHWVMKGPLGTDIEWDAETTRMDENERIAWNSKDNSAVRLRTPAYSSSALPSGRCCTRPPAETPVVYVARNAKGVSSLPLFSARWKETRPTRFHTGFFAWR